MRNNKKHNSLKNKNKYSLDYKDIDSLKKFMTEQHKILSRRSTGLNAKQQKKITQSIKRARALSLLPFLYKDQ